jgi:hypothetical protein
VTEISGVPAYNPTKLRQRQSVAVDLNNLRKETPNQQPLIWPVLNVNI